MLKYLSRSMELAILLTVIALGSLVILFFGSDTYHKIHVLEKGQVFNRLDGAGKIHYTISEKNNSQWVSLRQINYQAMRAIQISEDWMFFAHQGLDFAQLTKAIETTLETGGQKVRGASTISQQVAKNLFTDRDRSLKRKLQELVWTLVMEWKLPKVKILEIYLNIAEFGPSLYGIKQASAHYFNKTPSQLNPREGAFLAMLLPNPKRYAQSFREKRLTPFAKGLVQSILTKLRQEGVLSEQEFSYFQSARFDWEMPEEEGAVEERVGSSEFDEPDAYQKEMEDQ